MKKRIITLLAVLAVLVTCVALTVQAKTDKATFEANYGKCPCGCGQNIADINWNTGGTLYNTVAAGHYKKTGNFGPGTGATISSTVVIYLDGSASTNRIIWGKSDAGSDAGPRTFYITATGKLYIIGNNATVTGRALTKDSKGNAQNGGIAYVAAGGELNLSGDLVVEVNSATSATPQYGGVIFNAGTTTLTGDVILNAYAKTLKEGMGIYNSGTLNISGNVQINGAASGKSANVGGAIYTTGADARVEMSGGTITANSAFAGGQGAAVAVYSNAEFNMTGGSIVNESKTTSGIRVQNAKFYLQGGEVRAVNGNDGRGAFDVIATSSSNTAVLVLANNAKISNLEGGSAADNSKLQTYSGGYGKLYVDNNWNGHANITIDFSADKTYGKTYGRVGTSTFYAQCGAWDAETEEFTQGGGHKGTLIASSISSQPKLYGNSGLLMVMRVLLMGEKNGEDVQEWYITAETALNAQKTLKWDNAFVRMCCDTNVKVPAGVTAVVDLNGVKCTGITLVDDKSTLYFWDQDIEWDQEKNPAMEPTSATVTGEGAEPYYVRNGKTYVLNEGKVYPVEYKITNVSLRPSATAASLYYTASVKAHADAGLQNWGVAVSINPNAGATLADYMYTQTSEVAEDNAYNGVLVKDIAKNGSEKNAEYAAKVIYAKAYLTLADGTVVFSAAADKDLTEIITAVEAQDQSAMTEAQKTAIADMQASAWYADIFGAPEA